MSNLPNRRRFLELTGTGVAASVAGCSGLNPLSTDDPYGDKLTAIVEPDREDVQEIQEDLMAGEIEQSEAIEELDALAENAITSFEDLAADDDGVTIEESERFQGQMGEFGVFLIDGEPESIIAAVMDGEINQLTPGSIYGQFLEQQEQQEQQEQGQQQPPENGAESDDETDDETDDGDDGDDETDDGDDETDDE